MLIPTAGGGRRVGAVHSVVTLETEESGTKLLGLLESEAGWRFPGGASGKDSVCQCRRHKGHGFHPWVGKIPWRRKSHLIFMTGEFHEQRNLESYSPWGRKESHMTEAIYHRLYTM